MSKGRVSAPELRRAFLADLDRMSDDSRATVRAICAGGRMPGVKRRLESAEAAPSDVFPDVHAYCLKAIEVSAKHDRLSDLYINLALQAQGRTSFDAVKDADLLKDNGAGRTRAAIFKAENAGEPAYAGITGQQRPL